MTQPLQDQPGQARAGEVPPPPPAPYEGWTAHAPTHDAYAAQPYLPPVAPPHTVQPVHYLHPTGGGLGIAVMALAGAVAVLEVVEAMASWTSEDLYQEALARGEAPMDVVTPMDVASIPLSLAVVASWIVTAIWLSQARHNAEVLHPSVRHARSKVWAWIGWIVPVVSFWFPFQFVRDVRIATVSDERKYSTGVKWWWTAWLTYVLSSRVSDYLYATMTPGQHGGAGLNEWETIGGVAAVVAAVLWIRLVREVRRDQWAVAMGRPTVRVAA